MCAFGAGAAAQQDPSTSPRPEAAPISVRLAQAERSRALEGSGQAFPNKPIRYITPYAPGGSTSFTARLFGQRLSEAWGQPVIVDNRPGANTVIGTAAALKSRPDGYTLVSLGNALASNHTLVKTPYDALKDIAPIATMLSYENVLVVSPSLSANTVKELIALAKAKPAQLTYGTSASGGATHLLAELLNIEAGIKTRQIPYKGGGPAVSDLMGGHIDFFMSNPANVAAQIKSGRLRALAVTGESRVAAFPDVPTFAEEGLPAMTLTNWQGVGGPAGIPKPIVERISAEIRKIVGMPDTKEKLNAQGFEPYYNNAEQTAAILKAEIAKYARIIKAANIKPE
jgi:tripartite-type tricarboxylate transporter receptor subunit TctC